MLMQVKDIMSTEVISVSSDIGLDVLEAELSQYGIAGAPVVEDGKVLGVVSRSDIINQLNVEHTYAVRVYDYYDGAFLAHDQEEETDRLGAIVGSRMEHLTVKDVMNHTVKSVSSELSIADAATQMLEQKVHRLLVIDEKLVGILSSTDFVRLCAKG